MYQNELRILSKYLSYISSVHNLQITITDNFLKAERKAGSFTDFLFANESSREILQPFLVHNNSYCMQIKSNRILWDRCIRYKECIFKKLENNISTLYGMCHAGIEEYVVPVLYKGNIIAIIHAGSFCTNEDKSRKRIKKISRKYKISEKSLLSTYFASVKKVKPNENEITTLLNVAAVCISSIYSYIEPMINDVHENSKAEHKENYVLMHIIEYIKQNYRSDITINDISRFCHCSRSYISHIFTKNMNQNINSFINSLRIEEAKVYLINTNLSIKIISDRVGFNDPNYFSKVFTSFTGLSPKEYRKQNKQLSFNQS